MGMVSVDTSSLATMSQSASSSLRGRQVLLRSLFDIAKQHVPLAQVVQGHPYPEHWDSQPFVLCIGQAMVELAGVQKSSW